MPRRWRAGVLSSLWGVSPSLISLVKRWVGGRAFFKARGCSGGWLVCNCIVLFFALDVVAENGVEVVGGAGGDGSRDFCRFRHCSSRRLGMSAGGKRNLVFSLWGRQDQPLRVRPLWNTLITPGRNPQTASSGNRTLTMPCFLLTVSV